MSPLPDPRASRRNAQRRNAQRRNAQRGMILPVVLVAMLLVFTMSASLQHIAWRSLRGAVTQWNAQRGLYAADALVARALDTFSAESLASTPIGTALQLQRTDTDGLLTRVSLMRSAPNTVVAHASSALDHAVDPATLTLGGLGDATRIHREVWRAARLEPPPLPILAAATILGVSTWSGAQTDGRDLPPPRDPSGDDCGQQRDTASMPAVFTTASSTAPSLVPLLASFDDAWSTILQRAHPLRVDSTGTLDAVAPWRAHVIQSAHTVTVANATHIRGLLAVDGDLTVLGTLRVDGLLVVRGTVAATTGTLRIVGALIVRDPSASGSSFGANASVTYAPCLAGRALTTVSRLSIGPLGGWNSP